MSRSLFTALLLVGILFFSSCDTTNEPPTLPVAFKTAPSDGLSTMIQETPSDFTWEFFNDNIEVSMNDEPQWSGEMVLSAFQVQNGEVVNRTTTDPVETTADELTDGLSTEELFSSSSWIPGLDWVPTSTWFPGLVYTPENSWSPSEIEEGVIAENNLDENETMIVVYAHLAGESPEREQTTRPFGVVMMKEEPSTGTLEVTTTTSGDEQDDSYEVLVDGTTNSIGANETITVSGLEEGEYEVELADIAENCEVEQDNPRTVTVTAGNTVSTQFEVMCQAETKPQIIFEGRGENEKLEIYATDSDGSRLLNLTDHPAKDENPVWSPDGSKIAFESDRAEQYVTDIYVMDADGSNPVRLTSSGENDFSPAWSPSGNKIAFVSQRNGSTDIYVMNADGTNQTRVTNSNGRDDQPLWSPNGSHIVFRSNRDGNKEIYVMDSDGSNEERLTNHGLQDCCADWSPDGNNIVYTSFRDGNPGDYEIYRMNTDGSDKINLSDHTDEDRSPVYSPDGTKIAFIPDRDGSTELYVMNEEGSNQTRLTTDRIVVGVPAWSPNGSKITYAGSYEGDRSILVINEDGTDETVLTADLNFAQKPKWRPQ